MIQKCLHTLVFVCMAAQMSAQEGDTGYQFLSVPTSAHSAALGGNNVSVIEDDATLIYTNPALLVNVADKTLNLNFTSYIASTSKLGATFTKKAGERGSWALGGMVLNYGEMTETNANFEELGKFSASDICVQGGYSYLFSDRWSGGVQGKVLMSNYGEFSSVALGVDLGLNYYDEEHGWSVGLVAQNLGGQVDALYETSESLPCNVVLGVSKELENAPLRLSCTFDRLTDWDIKKPINHLSFGLDFFPSGTTWVALGYNPRRANEMKVVDSSKWAGLSLGAGLGIKKLKIGLAYGKYHVSSSSIIVNASYSL